MALLLPGTVAAFAQKSVKRQDNIRQDSIDLTAPLPIHPKLARQSQYFRFDVDQFNKQSLKVSNTFDLDLYPQLHYPNYQKLYPLNDSNSNSLRLPRP